MKIFAGLCAVAALTLAPAPATAAAPPNDAFADAIEISAEDGFRTGSTVGATKEAGEPAHAGNPGGHSIWFSWTAPADGTYVFGAGGSSLDTLLAVYTGNDVGALTEVASNDDVPDGQWSESAFFATEGTEYAIAVDGFGGKSGVVELSWRPGAPNDLFARPQAVTGTVGSTAGTNSGATTETGEPRPVNSLMSVWFEWTAPETRLVKFSVLAGFDAVLGVYTGTSVDALTEIATNDDDPAYGCCSRSFVGFDAVAGTVYRIAVGSYGDEGRFALSWSPLIMGTNAGESLFGTPGVEEIRALGGNDLIFGLGGGDVLVGGSGNDRIRGGDGNDRLVDHRGLDVLEGGAGADVLDARDFLRGDILRGGPGRDACRADRSDTRRSC